MVTKFVMHKFGSPSLPLFAPGKTPQFQLLKPSSSTHRSNVDAAGYHQYSKFQVNLLFSLDTNVV